MRGPVTSPRGAVVRIIARACSRSRRCRRPRGPPRSRIDHPFGIRCGHADHRDRNASGHGHGRRLRNVHRPRSAERQLRRHPDQGGLRVHATFALGHDQRCRRSERVVHRGSAPDLQRLGKRHGGGRGRGADAEWEPERHRRGERRRSLQHRQPATRELHAHAAQDRLHVQPVVTAGHDRRRGRVGPEFHRHGRAAADAVAAGPQLHHPRLLHRDRGHRQHARVPVYAPDVQQWPWTAREPAAVQPDVGQLPGPPVPLPPRRYDVV